MLKNIAAGLGLGLCWFLAGAFIGLIVFEGFVDPDGKIADIWPAVLGYPGFFGGVTFFALTRLFERRRLHRVSFSHAAIWGALSAPLLTGTFLLGMTTGILGNFKGDRIPWSEFGWGTGLMIPAFAVAGCLSVWMARNVEAPPGTRAEVGRTS